MLCRLAKTQPWLCTPQPPVKSGRLTGSRPMTDVLERIFCKIGTGWHIAAIPDIGCVAEFDGSDSVQRRHDHCTENHS